MSVEEKNKVLVRRYLDEVYNRGNLNVADELLAAEYVDHTVPPGKYAGREGLKRSVAKQRASSSDLHITIEEQIAEGDKVVTWVIGSGTHDRESFMGLAPTRARNSLYGPQHRRPDGRGVELGSLLLRFAASRW